MTIEQQIIASTSMNSLKLTQPCILCGDDSENTTCLCNACQDELPYIKTACPSCGIPLDKASVLGTYEETSNEICGACMTAPPTAGRCVSVLHYDSPVDYLIKHMKYHNQLAIAELMGKLIATKVKKQALPLPEQIIPIPLHIDRLQQRGYNQAIEIGKTVSRELAIPLNLTDCTRIRSTTPQFDLPANERVDNIKNAFEISHQLKAKHVALIDDVMTTGSTVQEVAKELLNSGATQVDIWVCARATTD